MCGRGRVVSYTLFLIIAPFAAAVSLLLAAFALRHRQEPSAVALFSYIVQVSALLICNTLELVSEQEQWTLFWAQVNHLFYSFIPVAWLAFALIYAGATTFVQSGYFLMATIFPLGTNIVVHTNSYHSLFWESIHFARVEGFTTFAADYGPWFWASGIYSYGLLIVGAVLIGRAYFGGLRIYRKQSAWMIAGALTPLAANLAYVFRLFGPMQKDYTPVGFALAGAFFVVGAFRYRLFDVVPAARATILDGLDEGFFVLDSAGRLVDINLAAQGVFRLDESAVGVRYTELAPIRELLANRDVHSAASFDVQFGANSDQRHYNVVIKPFQPRASGRGALVMIHDITDRVRLLAEKTKLVDELEHALSEIKTLRGIIPICSVCKKIRDGTGYWHQVEAYIARHSNAEFSHGLCEECAEKIYSELGD